MQKTKMHLSEGTAVTSLQKFTFISSGHYPPPSEICRQVPEFRPTIYQHLEGNTLEQNDFLNLAAEILETEVSDVSLDSNLDDLDWDSLANISFIAEIDSRLNKSVNPESLNNCVRLGDVFALISN